MSTTHDSDDKPKYRVYGIVEARAKFSEIIQEAQSCVVIITNHGRPVAVIIGIKGASIVEAVMAQTIEQLEALVQKYHNKEQLAEQP